MKWFKHLVGSGDDPDIDDSFTLFGSDGPWVFFRTLEVMSREFDMNNPGKNVFSIQFFSKKHRISWRKVVKILEHFQKRKRIFFKLFDVDGLPSISLNCPKLKKLCDEYAQRELKKNRDKVPTEIGSDSGTIEIEVDTDKDKRKKEKERKIFLSYSFDIFWKAYPGIKTAKDKCWRKWNAIGLDRGLSDKIMRAIQDQIAWRKYAKPNEFRPEWRNPHTWLNQKGWTDDVVKTKPVARYKDFTCVKCKTVFKYDIDAEENMCSGCHGFYRKDKPLKPDSKVESFIAGVAGSMGGKK